MSVHIEAGAGEIAEAVLLPGDPLRARFIAETFLEGARCYNQVRGMLGYTGTWNGRRVSVQGSGMGMPSLAIYVNELIKSYGVKRLIRVGSCGSLQPNLGIHEIVFAMTASTDSAMNDLRFRGMTYAPAADWHLFARAIESAGSRDIPFHAGGILSSDSFYTDDPDQWRLWAAYNVLAVEMETNQLYTLAAKHGVSALTILTVSDSLVSREELSAADRERSFHNMATIALDTATG